MSKIVKRILAACVGLLLAGLSFVIILRFHADESTLGLWYLPLNLAALCVGVTSIMAFVYVFKGTWMGEDREK